MTHIAQIIVSIVGIKRMMLREQKGEPTEQIPIKMGLIFG